MKGLNNNYTFAECLDGLHLFSVDLLEFVASDVIFRAKNCDQCLFFSLYGPYRSLCHIEANVRC